jgi:hypothetical protein
MNFIENYHFIEKKNDFQDKESFYNQTHLVGGFPIYKIPHVSKEMNWKPLEKYGIPAGFVLFNNKRGDIISGGGGDNLSELLKLTPKTPKFSNVISENEFDTLFDLVSYKTKKNTTRKNRNNKL